MVKPASKIIHSAGRFYQCLALNETPVQLSLKLVIKFHYQKNLITGVEQNNKEIIYRLKCLSGLHIFINIMD